MVFSTRIALAIALLLGIGASPVAAEIASTPAPPPAEAAPSDPKALTPPEEIELQPQMVVFVSGQGQWDDAETIFDTAFKSIYVGMARQSIHATGVPMVEYLDSDDTSFSFKAMVPVEASAKEKIGTDLGPDVLIGTGPTGKTLKFTHRGSFDDLEQVYNRIDDYLASKNLSMTRVVEEYVTDQRLTPDNEMVTNIYVFAQ